MTGSVRPNEHGISAEVQNNAVFLQERKTNDNWVDQILNNVKLLAKNDLLFYILFVNHKIEHYLTENFDRCFVYSYTDG